MPPYTSSENPKKISDLEKTIVVFRVYNFGTDGVSIRTATVNKHNPVYNLKVPHIKAVYEINRAASIKEKYTQRRPNCIVFLSYD